MPGLPPGQRSRRSARSLAHVVRSRAVAAITTATGASRASSTSVRGVGTMGTGGSFARKGMRGSFTGSARGLGSVDHPGDQFFHLFAFDFGSG